MSIIKSDRAIGILIISFVAIVFGLATIKSGGTILFSDVNARLAAGNYVPFVLWFNFIIGFLYIITGMSLFMKKNWAVWLSFFIVASSSIIFLLLGIHILNDGLFESRTVVAMILRVGIWTIIAIYSYRKIIRAGANSYN